MFPPEFTNQLYLFLNVTKEGTNKLRKGQSNGRPPSPGFAGDFATSVALFLSLLKLNTTMLALIYFVDSW